MGTLIERFAHTCLLESREFLSNNVPGLTDTGYDGNDSAMYYEISV